MAHRVMMGALDLDPPPSGEFFSLTPTAKIKDSSS